MALDQPVRLLTPTGIISLPVVGLLEMQGAGTFNGGAVAFMPLATGQRVFGFANQLNSIQIVPTSGAKLARLGEALAERLPDGLIIQEPAARGDLGRDSMASTEQGLASLSVSSLVAGAFVILNTFLMNLGERRRQLAILRAIGATRLTSNPHVARQALLLGVAGTLIGIPIGLVLAIVQRAVLAKLLAVTLPALRWNAEPFVIALLLGPGMALAATYFPAAGRVRSPLEDLLQKKVDRLERVRIWPAYLGLAILGLVVLFALGILWDWLPADIVFDLQVPAMGAFLIGCVLVVPLFQAPLMRLAGAIFRPTLARGRLGFETTWPASHAHGLDRRRSSRRRRLCGRLRPIADEQHAASR